MGKGEIALESNIVIPLPEARDFIIDAERKEGHSQTVSQMEYIEFYSDLIKRLESKLPRTYSSPQGKSYYQISTGIGAIHFEWAFHGRPRSSFGVELHFERGNHDANLEVFSHLEDRIPALEKALQENVIVQKEWGNNWSRLYIEKGEGQITDELKEWAVEKMAIMIGMLQPALEKVG
jgi:hypothetical protein